MNDLIEVGDVGAFSVDNLSNNSADILWPRQRCGCLTTHARVVVVVVVVVSTCLSTRRGNVRAAVAQTGARWRRSLSVDDESTSLGGSWNVLGDRRQAARVTVAAARWSVLDAVQWRLDGRRQLLAFVPRQRRRRRHRRRRRTDAQRPFTRAFIGVQATALKTRRSHSLPVCRPRRSWVWRDVVAVFFGRQHFDEVTVDLDYEVVVGGGAGPGDVDAVARCMDVETATRVVVDGQKIGTKTYRRTCRNTDAFSSNGHKTVAGPRPGDKATAPFRQGWPSNNWWPRKIRKLSSHLWTENGGYQQSMVEGFIKKLCFQPKTVVKEWSVIDGWHTRMGRMKRWAGKCIQTLIGKWLCMDEADEINLEVD